MVERRELRLGTLRHLPTCITLPLYLASQLLERNRLVCPVNALESEGTNEVGEHV
jgi:hypothetical protein